ncbi:head-tail adaptor protein [bacterium]|nr:head-tail adaptor protein [bacterium]
MGRAGDYPNRVQVLLRTVVTNNIGEAIEDFTPAHYLWCRVEEENSHRTPVKGGMSTGVDGTIYLRSYPTINTTDKVRDSNGRTWEIVGKRYGNLETILDVTAEDELVDYTEVDSD